MRKPADGPGKEEYLNSEKYEVKHWDVNRGDSLAPLMGRINAIRRENPALQSNEGLRFHDTGNDWLLAYSKVTADLSNAMLMVVNLDPTHVQSGMVTLPLEELGVASQYQYEVDDLLTGARYVWTGPRNYVELNPGGLPAHILRVARNVRREQDYDYYV
jgi:starch synthase (maltosyl-transferring)